MKNLVVGGQITSDFSTDGVHDIETSCSDPDTGDVYIYAKGNIFHHIAKESPNLTLLIDCKQQFPDTIPNLVGMCYSLNLCLAFDNGDVATVDTSGDWQIVGCFSSGIVAWEWSPDQELLALVTGDDVVVLMTSSFDPISEIPLRGDSFGEQQFVNVGWGKRETQFQGSAGKAAATAEPEPAAAVTDDGLPRVTWRGDGAMFAIGAREVNGQRCVRVFSREAVLQYTSAEIPGMEASLAWRPCGNMMASTQRLPNKHVVVLLEKNGLRHGDFVLPFVPGEAEVTSLSWSPDSSVLAVWLVVNGNTQVQLWTTGNFHWYLKQVIAPSSPIRSVSWHQDELRVTTANGRLLRWRYLPRVARCGPTHSVAVIDGCQVLLSCFRHAVPPPPMASRTATLPAPVNEVACAYHEADSLIAATATGKLFALGPHAEDRDALSVTELEWVGQADVSQLHHWLWLSPNQIVACITVELVSTIVWATLEGSRLVQSSEVCLTGIVTHLVRREDAALAQLTDGTVVKVSPKEAWPAFSFPEPGVELQPIDAVLAENGLLALTQGHRLYLGKRLLARNVTSFVARPPFLLVTTQQHRLVCARLDALVEGEPLDCGETAGRRLERGARLVAAPADDTRVVTQAPRGSLETVQPRALCLDVIARSLDAGRYRDAFMLARTQRISLGLLADHEPERFLRDAETFVDQVRDPAWLALFISELRDEDVTQTLYASHYTRWQPSTSASDGQPSVEKASIPSEGAPSTEGKVHRVCARLRDAMSKSPCAGKLLQPILASYVRQGDMGDALLLTRNDAAALKFLSCLVDVNQLFDTALGLYDLELAAFVAANSQKDPKEYLPFLNNLRTMDPDFRRYSIDVHLRRPALALAHIARCGSEHLDTCFALVEQHALHKQALTLFPAGSEGWRRACLALARTLESRRRHTEAALLLRRAGELPAALEQFVLARDWRAVLSTATEIGLPTAEAHALCRWRLAPALADAGEHAGAADMFLALADVEEAVAALARAGSWGRAEWEARNVERKDLIETHVLPAANAALARLRVQIAESSAQFDRHRLRLAVVRTTPAVQPHLDVEDTEHSDLFSQRSTVRSISSRGSRSSGKSRRRTERKQLSLREGGPFEAQALVRTLHALVVGTSALTEEVSTLCLQLVHWNRDTDASALQVALGDALEHMRRHCTDVWVPSLANATSENAYGPEATAESILAAMSLGGQPTENALIEPEKRFAPTIANPSSWQLEML